MRERNSLIFIFSLAALLVPLVHAAESADTLPEVVVQAESAAVQDTPAAMNVLQGSELDAQNVRSLSQLQLPTLSISAMGGRATPHYVSLRGFTNPWSAPESAVAVYLDGVPLSDFYALDQNLFDIDFIELRRGPQGTAYGVNGEAGVIDIRTQAPSAMPRAWGQMGAATPEAYAVQAGAVGSLLPRLQGSFAISRDGGEGYVDNLTGEQPYNGEWGRDIRGQLRWQAGESADISFLLLDRKIDDGGGELYLPVDLAAFNQLPTLAGYQLGDFDQALSEEGYNRLDSTLAALTARWRALGVQWQAVASWRSSKTQTLTDFDLSPQPWFAMESHYEVRQSHAELRAESTADENSGWHWLTGMSLDAREFETLRLFSIGPGNPWAFPQAVYPRADATQPDRTAALFGEGGWRFGAMQRWGITAGLRVEQDQRRVEFGDTTLAAGTERERRDLQVLPKLVADWRLSDASLLYASLAQGGKAGGFNPGAFDGRYSEFEPELTLTSELGLKGGKGETLAYRFAVFHNDIRDYQDLVISDSEFTMYIANAPRARTQGLEAELTWRPLMAWQFGFMLGRVDATYEDYLIDPARGVRLDGHALQQVPRWNGRLDAQFNHGPWWAQLALDGAGRYAINAYDGSTGVLREEYIDGYAVLGLHAGWRQGPWSAQVDGRNLANRRYFPNATYGFNSTALYSGAAGATAPGRTLGLSLRREF